ncbi:MAG: fluoride efflux transporter CrcB [Deltaproteobacteria bacterium]|nr:fluoride efflux transporter CrcB [Deltaproteobacteria bacterium]
MKTWFWHISLVGFGGMFGSVLRYLVGGWVQHHLFQAGTFPFGTLAVNICGCFLIGAGSGMMEIRHLLTPELRLLLMVGFLGGFTTFSTFGLESWILIRDGSLLRAAANIVFQVFAGLAAVWLGYSLSQ